MSLFGRSKPKQVRANRRPEIIRVIRSAEAPMFVGLSRIEGAQNRRDALTRVIAKVR